MNLAKYDRRTTHAATRISLLVSILVGTIACIVALELAPLVIWVDDRAQLPKPKGGVKKAFDIPLSRPMIRCILRAMRAGRVLSPDQAEFWLFPADSDSGHLIEHKEERKVLSKWGNDLRQSYRTLAQAAGVSELDIHLLMNHSLPGVNAGYITRDSLLHDHLRKQQERISKVIIDSAKGKTDGPDLSWLHKGKVATLRVRPEEELKAAA